MTKAVPGDQTVKLLVGPELPRSPSSGMNQAEGRRELPMGPQGWELRPSPRSATQG